MIGILLFNHFIDIYIFSHENDNTDAMVKRLVCTEKKTVFINREIIIYVQVLFSDIRLYGECRHPPDKRTSVTSS